MAGRNYIQVAPVIDGVMPKKMSIADVLHMPGQTFSLFTPALLFTHGKFDRDPVVEFASYYSEVSAVRPFYIDLQREHEFFFRGFGVHRAPQSTAAVNWDKRLFAIPNEAAEDCFSFIGGIGWANPETGFFGRTFSYPAEIVDPTDGFGATLPVRIFGVVAPDFVVFVDTAVITPTVRLINTNKPLDVLESLGADIDAYKQILNPFTEETDG